MTKVLDLKQDNADKGGNFNAVLRHLVNAGVEGLLDEDGGVDPTLLVTNREVRVSATHVLDDERMEGRILNAEDTECGRTVAEISAEINEKAQQYERLKAVVPVPLWDMIFNRTQRNGLRHLNVLEKVFMENGEPKRPQNDPVYEGVDWELVCRQIIGSDTIVHGCINKYLTLNSDVRDGLDHQVWFTNNGYDLQGLVDVGSQDVEVIKLFLAEYYRYKDSLNSESVSREQSGAVKNDMKILLGYSLEQVKAYGMGALIDRMLGGVADIQGDRGAEGIVELRSFSPEQIGVFGAKTLLRYPAPALRAIRSVEGVTPAHLRALGRQYRELSQNYFEDATRSIMRLAVKFGPEVAVHFCDKIFPYDLVRRKLLTGDHILQKIHPSQVGHLSPREIASLDGEWNYNEVESHVVLPGLEGLGISLGPEQE